MAAVLQAQVGDSVALRASDNGPPHRLRVSGVALVSAPDVLFQPLNPLLGPSRRPAALERGAPADRHVRADAGSQPPAPGPAAASGGVSAVPGAQAGVQWQVQAQVDPATLNGSPSHALARAGQVRNSLQRTFPGKVQFVDNLSDALNTAAGDALYAEALFIMLAIPGAILALGLVFLAALGTADRDRRELALLRARGASRRQLLGLAAAEAALLGTVAGVLAPGLPSQPSAS